MGQFRSLLGGGIHSEWGPGQEIGCGGQEMGAGLSKAEVRLGVCLLPFPHSTPPPGPDLKDWRSGRCPFSEELC